jgi:MscS family membrane protein
MRNDSVTGTFIQPNYFRVNVESPLKLLCWALVLSLCIGTAAAKERFKNPLAPPDTSSPRATLQSFLDNVREAYDVLMPAYASYLAAPSLFPPDSAREVEERTQELLERAVRTLNLAEIARALRANVGLERALLLKEVLDRIPLPPLDAIPDATATKTEESESATDTDISRWIIPGTEITIARVEEGPRQGEYLFTATTVARSKEFYQRVRKLPYRAGATEGFHEFITSSPGLFPPRWFEWTKAFPNWAQAELMRQAVWQWIGLVLSVLLAALVPLWVDRWRRHKVGSVLSRRWKRFLVPVSVMLVTLGVRAFVEGPLNLTGNVLQVVRAGLEVVLFVAGSWAVVSFSGVIAETIISSPRISEKGLDASLLRLGFRVLGLVIALLIIFKGLTDIGVPVLPVAAAAGVSGLAVALAAQPTLENFIASLTLYFDRPLKVGDFCRYGEDPAGFWRLGTVEEIGLRSVRLRGIDRTVTTIPNADFAKLQLINLAKRDRMLLRTTIALRYETTPEQLRFVLAKLREMLLAHPKITEDPARVRFVGFGDYSLNVEIFAYGDTQDWSQFLGIQEDIYLRIMDIVKKAGTGFAFPSQTTYFTRDTGLNEEQSKAAEAEVEAWRSEGTLPFPEFAQAHRERVRNTLAFPPEGSPAATAVAESTPRRSQRRSKFRWRSNKPSQ